MLVQSSNKDQNLFLLMWYCGVKVVVRRRSANTYFSVSKSARKTSGPETAYQDNHELLKP